jgi:hypothetical protein
MPFGWGAADSLTKIEAMPEGKEVTNAFRLGGC